MKHFVFKIFFFISDYTDPALPKEARVRKNDFIQKF